MDWITKNQRVVLTHVSQEDLQALLFNQNGIYAPGTCILDFFKLIYLVLKCFLVEVCVLKQSKITMSCGVIGMQI